MPSPFRMKAASLAQVEVQFTRAAVVVPLPMGSVIEFGIKAKNQTDAPPLVYCNTFSATAGTLYAADVNLATVELEQALGIGDSDTSNDKPQVELAGEVGWSTDGINLFRSQTFTVIVEAPVISGGAPSLYNPPRYPVLDGNVLHLVRGDGTLGTASSSGGMTTLTTYTGNIGTANAPAGNIYGTFIGDGSGLTALNPNSFNASNWNGVDIGTNDQPLASITASHFVGIGTPCFEGDGSNLYNVEAISLYLDGGRTFAYSGNDGSGWASSLGITAPFFTGDIYNANFNGLALSTFINASDGTVNAALTAGYANTAGASQFDFNTFFGIGWGAQDIGSVNYPYGTVYASGFVGDGSGLTNVGGAPDLANYTGNIGWQYAPMGAIYATTISGDGGAGLTAAYAYTSGGASAGMADFNAFFSPTTNWTTMNLGGEGSPLGTVYANYFAGDGSGLTNVGGGGSNTTSDFDTFFAEMMGTTYGGMNIGISTPLNEVHANSFYGDGSSLSLGEGIARIEGSYPWTVKASYNGQPQDVRVADADHAGYADYSGSVSYADSAFMASVASAAYNVCGGGFNEFFSTANPPMANMSIGSDGWPIDAVYATNFYGDGSGLTNVGGGTPDLSNYTGTVGNSDIWCANVFSISAEIGTLFVDQYLTCYTGMSLPSPVPTGTICYSRHAGGHFYGMTDDGWKQLDN